MRAEQVTDAVAYHGEGPVWSPMWGGLRWVDMLAGDVLSLAADGSVERRHVGAICAAVRPRRQGGAVFGVERGFALEEPDGTFTFLDELWRDENVRMNEGGCDPDGRFYCGSMAYDKRPGGGALYRLDPDRSVRVVVDGVTISNGIDWSPNGALAYYNDTDTFRVDVFDYDRDAGLTGRRPFAETGDARPDGLDGRRRERRLGRALQRRRRPTVHVRRRPGRGGRATGNQGDGVHVRRSGAWRALHHDVARRARARRRAARGIAVPRAGRGQRASGPRVRRVTEP